MSAISIAPAFAAFTANGGTDGYVTVTDNSAFYPGAIIWLHSTTQAGQQGLITDLVSTTKIGIRFIGTFPNQAPTYGKNDCSAFTTANSASISQESQVVRVNPSFVKQTQV